MWRRQFVLRGAIVCCLVCFIIISCNKTKLREDVNINDKYTVLSTLTGAGELQPNTSGASGLFSGHFDETTGSLSFTLSWTKLSDVVNTIEIRGSMNELIPVTGFTYSRNGSLYSSVFLPAEALPDLLNGMYSINIKTSAYPSGEIGGSLQVQ